MLPRLTGSKPREATEVSVQCHITKELNPNAVSIQGTKTALIERVFTLGPVASIVARPGGDEFNLAYL